MIRIVSSLNETEIIECSESQNSAVHPKGRVSRTSPGASSISTARFPEANAICFFPVSGMISRILDVFCTLYEGSGDDSP